MANQKILIPYNFTDMDQKALEFAANTFKYIKTSRITLFHVYIPLPDIETSAKTVMSRLSSSMHFLTNELKEKEKAIQSSRQYLLDKGFSEDQVDYVFRPRTRSLPDEIIDAATEGNYQVIILNLRPHRIIRAFVQSVHNKVISSLRNRAVCIVT
ncbi:MAG: universal stress protein [Deltaproteobacteria bacterium]|nr:universal stress protein [Deltaproteobacteria bacterium]MBW2150740.1 universal stress protein [Deltaproteobacteria bacterium]